MSNYVIRDGDWYAEVDDIVEEIRAALDDVSRTCMERVEAETKRIYDDAYRLMPVKTGRSRDSLRWSVRLYRAGMGQGAMIQGTVTGRTEIRYIQSVQISSAMQPDLDALTLARHESASYLGREHPDDADLRTEHRQRARRNLSARAHARRLGKSNRKAAKQGNAMWLLLRWPEKAAADRLTAELGPLLEADMARHLED